jgi:hypothetical protein
MEKMAKNWDNKMISVNAQLMGLRDDHVDCDKLVGRTRCKKGAREKVAMNSIWRRFGSGWLIRLMRRRA